MVFSTDKEAIITCLKVLGYPKIRDIKIVFIKNTLNLEKMYVSKRVWKDLKGNKNIIYEDIGYQINFNKQGELKVDLQKRPI